jgi:hypothetical protein
MVWFGADTRASPASSAPFRNQFRKISCVLYQNKKKQLFLFKSNTLQSRKREGVALSTAKV